MFNDNVVSGSGGGNFVGCEYEYAIFVRAAAHLQYTFFLRQLLVQDNKCLLLAVHHVLYTIHSPIRVEIGHGHKNRSLLLRMSQVRSKPRRRSHLLWHGRVVGRKVWSCWGK